jgi:hypothetical protein
MLKESRGRHFCGRDLPVFDRFGGQPGVDQQQPVKSLGAQRAERDPSLRAQDDITLGGVYYFRFAASRRSLSFRI